MAQRRIGVFGGTFNPPHLGHISVAKEVMQTLALQEVWFVPSNKTPGKDDSVLLPGERRKQLLELSINAQTGLKTKDLELSRPAPSYTFDTLREIQGSYGLKPEEIYFIVGLDGWLGVRTWHRFPDLLREANFVIVSRPNTDSAVKIDLIADLAELCYNLEVDIRDRKELSNQEITYDKANRLHYSPLHSSSSSSSARSSSSTHSTANFHASEGVFTPGGKLPRMVGIWANSTVSHPSATKIIAVQVTPFDISSAEIRRLASNGHSVKGLVADQIVSFVMEEYKKI